MHIILAPDSFKGSLSARQAAEAMAAGARRAFPDAVLTLVPMADGGEGTAEALLDATGGEKREITVCGPAGRPVRAFYGLLGDGKTAVLEMASASGLNLVPAGERNPLHTTTRGTGELILAALDAGARRVLIGIGGSATNDGGAGLAQALGYRLLDGDGRDLPPGGAALARLARLEAYGADPRLGSVEFVAACDVTNPLLGPEGASAVYGPQKGATPAMVAELDHALARFAEVVRRDLGLDVADMPGAGAAGGLGAGLVAFCRAR
ncbi:MAG: glycerate kinase, partial [Patescibacteria group bacterium]